MRSDHHRIAFFSFFGDGPWKCYFCRKPVSLAMTGFGKLCVHHKNGNHEDDKRNNLVPSHWGCHTSYHRSGQEGNHDRRKVRCDSRTGVRDVKPYKTGFLVRYTCPPCQKRHYVGKNKDWTLEEAEMAWKEFDSTHMEDINGAEE